VGGALVIVIVVPGKKNNVCINSATYSHHDIAEKMLNWH
jgi:hypothetical protein